MDHTHRALRALVDGTLYATASAHLVPHTKYPIRSTRYKYEVRGATVRGTALTCTRYEVRCHNAHSAAMPDDRARARARARPDRIAATALQGTGERHASKCKPVKRPLIALQQT